MGWTIYFVFIIHGTTSTTKVISLQQKLGYLLHNMNYTEQ